MKKNRLREMLNEGKPTIGTHVIIPWPGIVEVIGQTGAFDYIEKSTGYDGEEDICDVITTLVGRCVDSRQNKPSYQLIFRSRIELAYPRQVELYRERKGEYELFVDDEYG